MPQSSIKNFFGKPVVNLNSKRCFTQDESTSIDANKKNKTETEKADNETKEISLNEKKDMNDRCLPTLSDASGWKPLLGKEMDKPYFRSLDKFVQGEINNKKVIYPPLQEVFNAFELCALDQIKVVILGQDPYHGPGQAHGLAFSVQHGIQIPPSLRNIYKEMHTDVSGKIPKHGCLENWAKQGVFMLNNVLTVRKGEANSHKDRGWEQFTMEVVRLLNRECDSLVFLLWGKPAQTKGSIVDRKKHLVITSSHPSPLGATKTNEPFISSKCFSRTNEYLIQHGKTPIKWDAL